MSSSTRVTPSLCFAVAIVIQCSSPLILRSCERQGRGYDAKSDVHFHDPMVDPLPDAPSLKMFNIYGVGKPTERYIAWPSAWIQPDHHGLRCTELS